MAKILTARQAVDTYFYDGATVTFGGFANGLMHPEEIMVALEEAARSSGHPRGLRVVYASGQGDSGERGLNHLAVDGMCTTVIGGHWGLAPKLGGLAAENKLAAYNLPQGVISGLFREIAAKRPGVITHVGLDTFVDPRLEGGKMNRAAHEAGDMVKLIELEGEEKLFYPAFPIDIAVIRATYADERGNCTFEREGVYAEALAHAKALGIATAEADGSFRPNDPVTRQDAMVFLLRAMQAVNRSVPNAYDSSLSRFPDGASVADYARTAMAAMAQAGVIQGNEQGKLNPTGTLNRAEMAVILHRALTL